MSKRINVKWTNRHSGESGYVKSVKSKRGYFENTFNQDEAKKYLNETMANSDIKLLNEIGEGKNNDFVVVTE